MNKKLLLPILLVSMSFSNNSFAEDSLNNLNSQKLTETNITNLKKIIAVSYFDNTSDIKELNPLKKGIADMLISDLSKVKSLKIVEREKLEKLIKEIDLGKTRFFNQSTAQTIGKGLQAQYILTGSYILLDNKFRVDARLIKIDTGEVVMSEKSEGLKSEFFDIQKDLVENIISSLNITLDRNEKKDLREYETKSFEAVEKYSKGLDAKDKGNEEEASKYFKAALESDSQYKLAETALDRLKIIVNKNTRKTNKEFDSLISSINLNDPEINSKVGQMFFKLNTSDFNAKESWKKRIDLLKFVIKNRIRPYISLGSMNINQESGALSIIDSMFIRYDPDLVDKIPEIYEYLSIKYPNDSLVNSVVKTNYESAKKTIDDIKLNKKLINDNIEKIENGQPFITSEQNEKNSCYLINNSISDMLKTIEIVSKTTSDSSFVEQYTDRFTDKYLKTLEANCKSDKNGVNNSINRFYKDLSTRLIMFGDKELIKKYSSKIIFETEKEKKNFYDSYNSESLWFIYLRRELQDETKELLQLIKETKKYY